LRPLCCQHGVAPACLTQTRTSEACASCQTECGPWHVCESCQTSPCTSDSCTDCTGLLDERLATQHCHVLAEELLALASDRLGCLLEISLNITECIARTTVDVCPPIGPSITVRGRALPISSLSQTLVEG
jgi:hypothetical protein